MAYTTVNELPEKLVADLLGSEYILLTDPNYSYKVSLDNIETYITTVTQDSYQELKNKVIDDVSNYVHANAIHYIAKATEDIAKGTPVKLIQNVDEDYIYVAIAGANDTAIGICEDGLLSGELGEIMVSGILDGIDTTMWTEGDLLYAVGGGISNIKPTSDKIQFIGYVLNVATSGKILINGTDSKPEAREVSFANTGTTVTATNVQDAIVELDSEAFVVEGRVTAVETRVTDVESSITDLQEIVFQQATAPTIAQGASDGDIWMDTTTNTLNVYREYPIGTGVYRWEPLLYKWDDTVDGGNW